MRGLQVANPRFHFGLFTRSSPRGGGLQLLTSSSYGLDRLVVVGLGHLQGGERRLCDRLGRHLQGERSEMKF